MTKKKHQNQNQKKKKTKAILILDRSGSMSDCAQITVEGYNEHVEEFQEQEKAGADINVCLVTFNGQVYEHIWNAKPSELQKASLESFQPNGSTALFAGIGYTIDKLMAEDDGDTAYWLIIITDGDENSSHQCCQNQYGSKHDPSIIAEILGSCEQNGNWTISFLGASKEKILQAQQNFEGNLNSGNCAAWSNTPAGAKRMTAQNRKAAKSYFSAREKGISKLECLYAAGGAIADYSDDADDADKQDKDLGIDIAVKALKARGPSGQSLNRNQNPSFNAGWQNSSLPGYVPDNVGTADVFATNSKCVENNAYQRPVNVT